MKPSPLILNYAAPRRLQTRSLLWAVFVGLALGFAGLACIVTLHQQHDHALRSSIIGDITDLRGAINIFDFDTGRYPTTAEGLGALITCPPDLTSIWHGPYIDKIPLDKWGSPYHYSFPNPANPETFDLHSLGPDKIDGTADDFTKDSNI